jgi:hypothetical protein
MKTIKDKLCDPQRTLFRPVWSAFWYISPGEINYSLWRQKDYLERFFYYRCKNELEDIIYYERGFNEKHKR